MKISHLFAGKPQPFGPRGAPSSIKKSPFQSLTIDVNGAKEDEQGNKKLHGGPEMALHQFSQSGYALLVQLFPDIADKLKIGSIGENISAAEMDEDNVHIGDIYTFGDAQLQVSSPRAPCSKINHRYQMPKVDLHVSLHGNTGWYFRVLKTGTISIGDNIELTHRNPQSISVRELMFMTKPPKNYDVLPSRLALAIDSPGLAREWQDKLKRVLKSY